MPGTSKILDIAVPHHRNIQLNYTTKIQKYYRLMHEITELWKVKSITVHPIVISAMENVQVSCVSELRDLGVPWVLAAVQKKVSLNTCSILRSFYHVPRCIRMYYRHRLGLGKNLGKNLGKLQKERENHLFTQYNIKRTRRQG